LLYSAAAADGPGHSAAPTSWAAWVRLRVRGRTPGFTSSTPPVVAATSGSPGALHGRAAEWRRRRPRRPSASLPHTRTSCGWALAGARCRAGERVRAHKQLLPRSRHRQRETVDGAIDDAERGRAAGAAATAAPAARFRSRMGRWSCCTAEPRGRSYRRGFEHGRARRESTVSALGWWSLQVTNTAQPGAAAYCRFVDARSAGAEDVRIALHITGAGTCGAGSGTEEGDLGALRAASAGRPWPAGRWHTVGPPPPPGCRRAPALT
jgi:hypothetical protein